MKKIIFFLLLTYVKSFAQEEFTYKTPPKDMMDLVLATPTPGVIFDSKGEWMLLFERNTLPSVEELAQSELRIAGLRMNPNNFSPSRSAYNVQLQLKNIKTGKLYSIEGLPDDLKAASIQWSPDDNRFAFTNSTHKRVDLYVVNVATKVAKKMNSAPLNTVLGAPYSWIGNNQLLYKTVPGNAKRLPDRPPAPRGPVVQESKGKSVASRTYQDLIKNTFDEELFAYMATSQLALNDMNTERAIGAANIYRSMSVSPDQRYILVQTIDRPFSYLVTSYGFPHTAKVIDLEGKVVKELIKNPSTEGAPIGFDDAASFPLDFQWRADEPATVTFVQALDKGLGKSKADHRDALYAIMIPGEQQPKELFRTKRRLQNVLWGNNTAALVYESMFADRKMRISRYNPSTGKLDSLFERSMNDAYSDIGTPMTTKNKYGKNALIILKNDLILLRSQGSSPEGDMPFIQTFDLNTKSGKILWRSQAPYYETIIDVLDAEKLLFVTSRESHLEVPNYYIRDMRKKSAVGTPVTDFKNPYPQLEGVTKQKVSYKRSDGIDLAGDLYLPKGYDANKDGPLPVLIWAYPQEFKSAADAAQIRGSKYTFTRVNYGGPIFWVTRGYAVLNNAEMPIVGEGKKEPNDHFIPQLYMNAHAAIQALAKMGVGDSNRVAVGGHSYGAFMTANLLAHTKLFKAGIARSGAYNRTLTPFGFQAEERTFWEAPDVYFNMSPFSFANKIKTPLLMIHGDADNNPGTFPIQSERLYNAIKGHGGTVRFVSLPYESHGYAAKENILHMLWEQDQWLETFVKNADKNNTGSPDKKAF